MEVGNVEVALGLRVKELEDLQQCKVGLLNQFPFGFLELSLKHKLLNEDPLDFLLERSLTSPFLSRSGALLGG